MDAYQTSASGDVPKKLISGYKSLIVPNQIGTLEKIINNLHLFYRNYATLAMLPIVNGERRAILYGGVETGSQVLTVCNFVLFIKI